MTNTTKQAERLKFVAAIQSCVTDLTQQYDLIAMYDEATRADTVRALQLEAIRKTLEVVNNKVAKLHKMLGVKGTFIAEQIAQLDEEEILKGLTQ